MKNNFTNNHRSFIKIGKCCRLDNILAFQTMIYTTKVVLFAKNKSGKIFSSNSIISVAKTSFKIVLQCADTC